MPSKIAEEIAKRLRTARKAAGFKTAKNFAMKQNIPISTYSQYETGKRSINAELIIAFSSKLQVNPYWLLTGNPDPYLDCSDQSKTGTLELEHCSISLTHSEKSRDLDLLRKILFAAEPLFNDKSIRLSYQELIDYCLDVYNIVSPLTANASEKEKIINLTLSSLKRGALAEIASVKDQLVK